MPYKPDGYTSLAPYLIVTDAAATLDFVHAVFGSQPLFVHRRPDGAIGHAEIVIDDSVLMVGQADEGAAAHVHVYVPDVDAAFRRALDAGGTEVQAIAEKGDGDRRGGVRDASGTTWWLSTELTPRAG